MNRTTVEEIKSRLPIDEVLGSYIKLDKAGKSLKAKCPFHNEKSASFFVSPDRGGYYCFGCGAKGDIFTFVEQFEGLDFRGALKILAEKAGVQISHDERSFTERDKLYKIMEEATVFFEQELSKSESAGSYVKSRGISDTTRTLFRMGWAPEGWRNLMTHLKSKGWSEALMEKAGLIKLREGSKADYYDRFRGRVMFPINDSSGRVVAFSGRILKDDGTSAKYLNSPDTLLYDKSVILFGLDKAKSEIRRMGYTIFVEGQMDLVMSHQAGIKNTVATSGTAMSDETIQSSGLVSNLGLVRRLSPNVIIAFDSDNAGRKAALRAAAMALSMGMDIKISEIVGGKDPADLVREDVEKWKSVLRSAVHVVEFELNNVIQEVKDERKLAKSIVERVLPLVARLESASDQSYFVQKISDKTRISSDALWQDVRLVERKLKAAAESSVATGRDSSARASAHGGTVSGVIASMEKHNRIDLGERQLFGIIYLMEKAGSAKAAEYRESLRQITRETYDARLSRAEAIKSDLMFEAEEYIGTGAEKWHQDIKEELTN